MLKEAIGTGATVELAKADAIAQLGISADSDIEIEVLEMPAKNYPRKGQSELRRPVKRRCKGIS